ncbi:Bifunctional protein BirA [Anaerotruncus sp. 2789STDY5834896]|uniref:Bifunctional ligase/repressor BirA n=1 Tax=uncultured Anaerotruncus sp. TaxID=905011 RepID=A0A1C6I3S2_9FIRM|nr:Bifunctional protein BirA [uncultured Anaerotruncus sp.]
MSETKYTVLQRLRQQIGQVVSSAQLVQETGVSRTAVWKAVGALKKEGYPITAIQSGGYRLEADGDVLSSHEIQRRRRGHYLGATAFYRDEVSSTNSALRALAGTGDLSDGCLLVAGHQTAGRGRQGRSFYSPASSGLYFSFAICRPLSLQALRFLTMVVALGTSAGIGALCGVSPSIKWPNDLLLAGKKCCGILTECSLVAETGSLDYAVVGVGINVKETAFPPELVSVATALVGSAGRDISRSDLLDAVLTGIEQQLEQLFQENWAQIIQDYRQQMLYRGQQVSLHLPQGQRVQAQLLDIAEDGGLLIAREGRQEVLYSGDIFPVGQQ